MRIRISASGFAFNRDVVPEGWFIEIMVVCAKLLVSGNANNSVNDGLAYSNTNNEPAKLWII